MKHGTEKLGKRAFVLLLVSTAIWLSGPALAASTPKEVLPVNANTKTKVFTNEQLTTLAEEAYLWGYPRLAMQQYWEWLQRKGMPPNQFFVSNAPSRAEDKNYAPAVDFLYGVVWMDVTKEPVVLEVPDTHDRYYSIQMMDAFSNSFAYVGRRTTGVQAGRFLIAGPDWAGEVPKGMSLIQSPSRRVSAYARTMLNGPADFDGAHAVQKGYSVTPLSQYPQHRNAAIPVDGVPYLAPSVELRALGAGYFDYLGDALADDAIPQFEQDRLKIFAPLGIGPGLHPGRDPAKAAILAKAVERGHQRILAFDPNTHANGWATIVNGTELIQDPLLKASYNRVAIGAHIAKECLYIFAAGPAEGKTTSWPAIGPDGLALNGKNRYRLRFPSGATPPVDAFWSLTMYDANFLLVPNLLDRYFISELTQGLKHGEDGSLEILIQHEMPDSGNSNWLPAPEGQFILMIRAYQPRVEMLNGSYSLPSLEIF